MNQAHAIAIALLTCFDPIIFTEQNYRQTFRNDVEICQGFVKFRRPPSSGLWMCSLPTIHNHVAFSQHLNALARLHQSCRTSDTLLLNSTPSNAAREGHNACAQYVPFWLLCKRDPPLPLSDWMASVTACHADSKTSSDPGFTSKT